MRIGFRVLFFCAFFSFVSHAFADVSVTTSGHAASVLDMHHPFPSKDQIFDINVPIGLLLQVKPSDKFSLFLGLDANLGDYPTTANIFGSHTTKVGSTPPFSNTSSTGGTVAAFGNKRMFPILTQAFFTYDLGLGGIKVGRFYRDWGLGLWQSAQWTPFQTKLSSIDGLQAQTDLGAFAFSATLERVLNNSSNLGAFALYFDVKLKGNVDDISASQFSKEVGLTYSHYSDKSTKTSLNIIDSYAKIYYSSFYMGGEILFPSGKTKDPAYLTLGGVSASPSASTTPFSQDVSAVAADLQSQLQIYGPEDSSVYTILKTRTLLPTHQRQFTQSLLFHTGYASGGSNQFDDRTSVTSSSNTISGIYMNSSIRPAFLMFHPAQGLVKGMPTGALTNTFFVNGGYEVEHPSYGLVSAHVTWGMLNALNGADAVTVENTCSKTDLTMSSCYGFKRNLGGEFDVDYAYTLADNVTLGALGGIWFVGDAWKKAGGRSPDTVYGARVYLSTQF